VWGGTHARTPDQVAADAKPPAPSMLTAAVERREMTDSVVLRATIATASRLDVAGPTLPEGTQPVVTRPAVAVGSTIEEGSVLAEVGGRPVFLLAGEVPVFRDMRPGDAGADIVQLQHALARLGLEPGAEDGNFGPSTEAALDRLYRSKGYLARLHEPSGPEGDTDGATRVQQAGERLAVAESSGDGAAISAARAELSAARSAQTALERESGAMVPFGEIVFVPTAPAIVVTSGAPVGTRLDGPLMTIAAGRSQLEVAINPAMESMVQIGDTATAENDRTGQTFAGTVVSFAYRPGTGDNPEGSTVAVLDTDPAIPLDLVDGNLRIVFVVGASDGPVLVVPAAAVFSRADGSTAVRRVEGGRTVGDVEIMVGFSADGFVEVTPRSDPLRAGDLVSLGR